MRRVSVATTLMPGHDHVSGLERLRGPVTVIRRCESLAELIAVARSGLADVLLVAGDTDQLTLTFCETIAPGPDGGRSVGVVALSEVASERERLENLGVMSAPPETGPAELAELIVEAALAALGPGRSGRAEEVPDERRSPGRARGSRRAAGARGGGPGTRQDERADAAGSAHTTVSTAPGPDPAGDEPAGDEPAGPAVTTVDGAPASDVAQAPPRTTAVWGPAGSPGRTTIAVNLAVELALAGRRTLLVDLDTYAASAGVHLGLLEESAGIAQACRLADQGRISPDAVARAAVRARVAGTTLQVLTGLTRSDRWPELRRAALEAVLAAAAGGWDEVVLDCGFSLEEDEELSFDVPAPQRNAATLAGLGAADRILAVGTGDPVGLPRLIRALEDLERVGPSGQVEVIVNQVRAEASGVAPQAQVRSALERFGPGHLISAFLPWDRRAVDRALLGGQVLAESAPKSAVRRAVAALAGPATAPGGASAAVSGRRRSRAR